MRTANRLLATHGRGPIGEGPADNVARRALSLVLATDRAGR